MAYDNKVIEALGKFMKVVNKKVDGDPKKVLVEGVGCGQK
jgi:hypothetical protein